MRKYAKVYLVHYKVQALKATATSESYSNLYYNDGVIKRYSGRINAECVYMYACAHYACF